MEQSKSKLVSILIRDLKIAYPYYFKDLTNEELLGMVSLYQEELGMYNEKTLTNAVRTIIRNTKFMPTLNEIIEQCEQSKNYETNEIIEKMKLDGYFKNPSEIDKTYKFVEEGIIPKWLMLDMKKYEQQEQELIGRKEKYLLEEN